MTEERRHWHLSRAVQLPVLILVISNVFASVWWAAKLDAKTQDVVSNDILVERLSNRDIRIENNSEKISSIHSTLNKLDEKLDKVLERMK